MTVHTLPTVHMNGTSRDELVQQLLTASHALQAALDKLGEAAPHPRDYYVNPDPNAYRQARAEHDARCQQVREVKTKLDQMAETIAVPAKDRRENR